MLGIMETTIWREDFFNHYLVGLFAGVCFVCLFVVLFCFKLRYFNISNKYFSSRMPFLKTFCLKKRVSNFKKTLFQSLLDIFLLWCRIQCHCFSLHRLTKQGSMLWLLTLHSLFRIRSEGWTLKSWMTLFLCMKLCRFIRVWQAGIALQYLCHDIS